MEIVDNFFMVCAVVRHRVPSRTKGCALIGVIRRSVLMATVVKLDDCLTALVKCLVVDGGK
ncbi:MAG: hypothetical protein GX425_04105 [Peptococcaceae bacterium]|nr:hypothetical protein [Peptococcaceae bacterium]